MSEQKKREQNDVIKAVVFASIVIIIVLAIIWVFTNKSEVRTSTTISSAGYSALDCSSNDPSDPFFSSSSAQHSSHNIKILFIDNLIKEISYGYEGTYNESNLEVVEAKFHANYNIYMGSNGLNPESLNPVFSLYKSKVLVSIYAEPKKLNSAVARLFFISEDEYGVIGDYGLDDYKKMYESKGFACKKSD